MVNLCRNRVPGLGPSGAGAGGQNLEVTWAGVEGSDGGSRQRAQGRESTGKGAVGEPMTGLLDIIHSTVLWRLPF
jgi:hypothetical protein